MQSLLKKIRAAIERGDYALRPHAVRHMLEEGFTEAAIVETILGGTIHEVYENEERCLVVGRFGVTIATKEYLHVVIGHWSEPAPIEGDDAGDWVDIVTAYIPRRPFWETPLQRGRRSTGRRT